MADSGIEWNSNVNADIAVQSSVDVEGRPAKRARVSSGTHEPASEGSKGGGERRSRTGCLTCRARKVKCDEQRPTCQPCIARRAGCRWPEKPEVVYSTGPEKPKRSNVACVPCRSRKVKCAGLSSQDGGSCQRCRQSGITCEWSTKFPVFSDSNADKASPSSSSTSNSPGVGDMVDANTLSAGALLQPFASEPDFSSLQMASPSIPELTQDVSSKLRPPPVSVSTGQQAVVTSLWSPKSSESLLQALSALSSDVPIPPNHMATVVSSLHGGPTSPLASDPPKQITHPPKQAATVGVQFYLSSSILNDKVVLHRLMGQYFDGPHQHGVYSFIHQASFMRSVKDGTVDRTLLLLVSAMAVRFGSASGQQDFISADQWAAQARSDLLPRLYDEPDAQLLVCMMLLIRYELARGNYHSGWMLTGASVRLMQIMSLHRLDDHTAPRPQHLYRKMSLESLRRLAWSVFYTDTIIDRGLYSLHCLTEDIMRIRLPCNERLFARGTEVVTEALRPQEPYSALLQLAGAQGQLTDTMGILAYTVRISAIRRRLLHTASTIKLFMKTTQQLHAEVNASENDLEAFRATLPPSLTYSEEQYYVHRDRIPAFTALHALMLNVYCILGRARLLLCTIDASYAHTEPGHRRRRIDHAIQLADLTRDALEQRYHTHDPQVCVIGYVALEILLFEPARLKSTDPGIHNLSQRCEDGIRILLELLRNYAHITSTVADLRVEACARLLRHGYSHLLDASDWLAYGKEYPNVARDEAELNFSAWDEARRHYRGYATDATEPTKLPEPRLVVANEDRRLDETSPSTNLEVPAIQSGTKEPSPPSSTLAGNANWSFLEGAFSDPLLAPFEQINFDGLDSEDPFAWLNLGTA